MRLLFIDDDEDTVVLFKVLLEKFGHSVEGCHLPSQCVGLAKTFRPDVIFLDLLMPINGFEIIDELRADCELKDIPVVL